MVRLLRLIVHVNGAGVRLDDPPDGRESSIRSTRADAVAADAAEATSGATR
jgi:hypothetical protein